MANGGRVEAADVIAGRYRLEKPLGAGGMGEVWIAHQVALDRKVALKLIRPDALAAARASDELVERFEQEARSLGRVQHPHVVQVIDAGRDDDGRLFLVMELLEGQTLRARMAGPGVSVHEAVRVAAEIASALIASHGAGVLHRDLKAENVFLATSAGVAERVKVLDFGLSRLASAPDKSLTPTGAIVGTPGYIAPEQVLGEPVDERADLYALGVILFELLTGAPPFHGQTAVELLMQHASVPAPRASVVAARRQRDVPAPLDALVAALLAKRASDRPRDAAAVRDALLASLEHAAPSSTPAAAPPQVAREPLTQTMSPQSTPTARPLFGRARELAALEAALEDAAQGRGGLVLLAGEPGIGKTRLCDAFAAAAARRGVPVLWGRAWEAGGAPAFHPWSEALEALVDTLPTPPSADDAAVLSEVVRSLRGRGAPPPAVELTEARFRLFAAVSALLKRASAERPLAILLDDLHAADSASLQLLLSVARELPRRRIVVVGTYRDVEVELNDDAKELVGRLAREARTLHLTRLESDDVDALVLTHAGHAVDAAVGRAIFKATQGNPLFVDEMVRLLSAQGRLDALGEAPLPIPLGVREAIRQRLARATGPTRAALEVLAVLGREARLVDAAAVHGAPLDDAVRDGVRFGVLARAERGVVRFTHALYREELLAELDGARAHALHARAAEVLRAHLEPPLAEIADHLLEAGPAHAERAIDAALEAAEAFILRLAFEDAAALVQRAIDSATDDARRADGLILLGRAVMLAGDVPRAHALCLRAAAIARARGDHELLARAALGYGARLVETVVDDTLVSLLREAARGLDDKPLWRARVLARLASAMQPAADAWGAVAIAHEAFALVQSGADDRTRLAVLHDGIGALMSVEPPLKRRPLNQEALRLAERFGDATRALRARFRLVLDAVEAGEREATDEALAAYRTDADRLGSRDAQWRAALLSSMLRAARADEEGAHAEIARAQAHGAPAKAIACHHYLRLNLMHRFEERDRYAAEWHREFARFDRGADAVAAAVLAMERGDVDGARESLNRLRGAPPSFFMDRFTMRVTAYVGDAERSAALLASVRGWDHRFVIETTGIGLLEPDRLLQATLVGALGRHAEAAALSVRAVDDTRAQRFDAMLPFALIEAATLHARAGERAAARALLDEGRARAQALRQPGLAPWIVRAEAALTG